ncbi:MAG: hypothetical protein BWY71_00030 [Planctomycetes bacterium ADurb.Bin412]|nr:MAG: hypothetical protein BWY71_00030 [Planctomycetes bacterium ADurb.Bin412]
MAVEAVGSKFSRNNHYILAPMCLAFAVWFAYDGWINKTYQQEETREDGTPTANLQFNRYAPIGLAAIAVYSLLAAAQVKNKRITADENGLTINGKAVIPYSSVTHIDKRFFEKEGHYTIGYKEGDAEQTLKLSDRKYDGLGLLLDELIRRTGAAPANADASQEDQTKTS